MVADELFRAALRSDWPTAERLNMLMLRFYRRYPNGDKPLARIWKKFDQMRER